MKRPLLDALPLVPAVAVLGCGLACRGDADPAQPRVDAVAPERSPEPVPAKVLPSPAKPRTPLSQQAFDTARWLSKHPQAGASALDISPARTRNTLLHLAVSDDVPATLASFQRIPVRASGKPTSWGSPDRFRMTRYLVYESEASAVRTPAHDTALYATPSGGLKGITRQQVYAGALDTSAEALVWMSRRDANRAMMQGTVDARYADGARRVFNVHQNNEIPYDKAILDGNKQPRFWSFREVEGVLGYGVDDKIPLQPMVAVAGDVHAFGVGTVFALVDGNREYVVVLADTGGAFDDNRHQLDWYTGSHATHEAFLQATQSLPHHVEVYALVAP